MSFDDIKAHLDRLFAYRPTGSSREQAAGLRAATIEFKMALGQLRETLTTAETHLERARRDATDYQRRGVLAEGIGDVETVQIATEYAARAQERVDVLERKVLVLRDEVHIAEREYEATKLRLQRATQGLPLDSPPPAPSREGEPQLPDDPFLDRQAREAAVDAQLAHLKKKLGREPS